MATRNDIFLQRQRNPWSGNKPGPDSSRRQKRRRQPFNYTEARRAASVVNSLIQYRKLRTELGKSVSKYNQGQRGYSSKPGFLHPDDDPQEVENTIDLWATQLGAVTGPGARTGKNPQSIPVLTANRCWESQKSRLGPDRPQDPRGLRRPVRGLRPGTCVERLPMSRLRALRELRLSTCGIFYC